jgi:hypothetical protein
MNRLTNAELKNAGEKVARLIIADLKALDDFLKTHILTDDQRQHWREILRDGRHRVEFLQGAFHGNRYPKLFPSPTNRTARRWYERRAEFDLALFYVLYGGFDLIRVRCAEAGYVLPYADAAELLARILGFEFEADLKRAFRYSRFSPKERVGLQRELPVVVPKTSDDLLGMVATEPLPKLSFPTAWSLQKQKKYQVAFSNAVRGDDPFTWLCRQSLAICCEAAAKGSDPVLFRRIQEYCDALAEWELVAPAVARQNRAHEWHGGHRRYAAASGGVYGSPQ